MTTHRIGMRRRSRNFPKERGLCGPIFRLFLVSPFRHFGEGTRGLLSCAAAQTCQTFCIPSLAAFAFPPVGIYGKNVLNRRSLL
ncbi:MAG: hypothetical protein JWM42_2598 [Burkholderia sp.]|nr:hypothetical protein [Burkholderia sp.]